MALPRTILWITSGGRCPIMSRAISLVSGQVESEWGSRTGTVVPMPFVDPQKRIPLG